MKAHLLMCSSSPRYLGTMLMKCCLLQGSLINLCVSRHYSPQAARQWWRGGGKRVIRPPNLPPHALSYCLNIAAPVEVTLLIKTAWGLICSHLRSSSCNDLRLHCFFVFFNCNQGAASRNIPIILHKYFNLCSTDGFLVFLLDNPPSLHVVKQQNRQRKMSWFAVRHWPLQDEYYNTYVWY